jgi:hypothetical protein
MMTDLRTSNLQSTSTDNINGLARQIPRISDYDIEDPTYHPSVNCLFELIASRYACLLLRS